MTVRDALLLSNVAFLTLVALAFVASTIVFLLNRASERAKDRELSAYHAASELRIHSARADAAAALERAVAGEAENLKTRERTAMLVREAAALHARTLAVRARAVEGPPTVPRIAEKFTERPLSNEQRATMVSVLIRHPGQVTVINGVGADTERCAADLRVIFSVSGWTVGSGVVVDPRIPLAPLSLVLGTSAQDMAIREAFKAAGVTVVDRPRSSMDRPTTIYVGS
jgi:hypothetical protein